MVIRVPGRAVGRPVERRGAAEKACGQATYAGDMVPEGALVAMALRSKLPHARVKIVDTSAALRVPGVIAAITARNIPGENRVGIVVKDEPVLVEDRVRRVGDPLALVAAETEGAALEGLGSIRVDMDELPPVFNVLEALRPGAPAIHDGGNLLSQRTILKGDPDAAFARAPVIVEDTYVTGWAEHAYLEPETCVAALQGETVVIWASTQNTHYDQAEVARVLGYPNHRVRVIQAATGGGFGGKLDISAQCHAALLAVLTGRPVRMSYSREESMLVSPKRHPLTIRYRSAAEATGRLMAVDVDITADTGAYASYGPAVLTRAAVHATGPYDVPNVRVRARAVYTNNPVAGAMRGFGVPQVAFAHEAQMDAIAARLGVDPVDLRLLNALRPGSSTATCQVLGRGAGYAETLLAAREEARRLSIWS